MTVLFSMWLVGPVFFTFLGFAIASNDFLLIHSHFIFIYLFFFFQFVYAMLFSGRGPFKENL